MIDIPLPVLYVIKEYVQHRATCNHCEHVVKGIFPDHVAGTACFGENFDELLSDYDWPKKMLELLRESIHLRKHREHIFLFLSNHKAHYDNNGSERALRPAKTKMKVSGQFRSHEGANNYAILMTIVKTAEKNGQNPFFAIQRLAEFHEE